MSTRSNRGKLETPVACECAGINEILKNVMNKLNECFDVILEQSVKISELQDEINKLNMVSPSTSTSSKKIQPTYSEAVTHKQEHVLVLKPKQVKEINQVKEDLRSHIKPADLQVGLNIERNTKQGGVILKCSTAEALTTVKDNIKTKMGNQYDVEVPKKFHPRIIITGIDKNELRNEVTEEDLIQRIVGQNRIPRGNNFKFECIYRTKLRKERFNLIAELDPNTFRYVMNGEKQVLHVGWSSCRVYEHFSIRRCFKCGGFNHESKNCNEKTSCVLCSEEHVSGVCVSEVKKCINCVRTNHKLNLNLDVQHTAIDRNCKCYLRVVESIRKKISYAD